MLRFMVPPGIGDFSAMYSKLCNIKRDMTIQSAGDGPHRLVPFLEILPNVKHEKAYGTFVSNHAVGYTLPPGTDLQSLPDSEYFLSVNDWLEGGCHISSWLPCSTDYHYPMSLSAEMKQATQDFMDELPIDHGPLIGVYCTAYGNSRHWGFWGPHDWFKFLLGVRQRIPAEKNPIFIFIGADYDLGIADTLSKMMLDYNADKGAAYFKSVYTIGRFHIGSTIELIRKLSYFFVFPSGLGFLADVVKTPHTMWFPEGLRRMRYTFTDPVQTEGSTRHSMFTTPEDAVEEFEKHSLRFLEGADVRTR